MIALLLALQLTAVAPEAVVAPGIWSRPAMSPDGIERAVAWSAGADTWARFESGPIVQCNTTTDLQQDEPEACWSAGRILVAWSDRSSTYSLYMQSIGRIYQGGVPVTGEVALTTVPTTAWRPLLAPRAGGGWFVASTGGWGEEVWISSVSPAGALDWCVQANSPQWSGSSQNYPDVAESGGVVGVVWRDAHGYHGTPNPALVFRVLNGQAERTIDGGKRPVKEPRIAAVPGGFIVTWEQLGVIWYRFLRAGGQTVGAPRVASFTGNCRDAEVATDSLGRVVIAWEARSLQGIGYALLSASGDVEYQGWANTVPTGTTSTAQVDRRTPSVVVSSDGAIVVMGWGRRTVSGALEVVTRGFAR